MQKILHVDDTPVWRDIVCQALKHYEVTSVGTYEDAVRELGTRTDCRFDIVIVDLDLTGNGGLEGEEILSQLRDGRYMARVIVMSGSIPGGAVLTRAKQFHADEIIYKISGSSSGVRAAVERMIQMGPKNTDL